MKSKMFCFHCDSYFSQNVVFRVAKLIFVYCKLEKISRKCAMKMFFIVVN